MKRNFLRLCLTMVVVLSFNSCRQDLLHEQENYNNSGAFQLKSNRISLNEAKHKAKLLPELEKAEAKFKEKSSAFGKIVNYGNGVSIDTDDVTYIENGPNYHTYTFNIKRENAPADAPVENLVLSPLTDGTYRELLITYNFTPQEKQTLMNGGFVDTKGKTTVTELASGTYSGALAKTSCSYQTVTIRLPCSAEEYHHLSAADCELTGDDAPQSYTMVALVCGADTSLGDDGSPGGGVSIGPIGGLGNGEDDGSGNTDFPSNEPGNCNGGLTAPQTPNYDISDGGCGGSIPTQPNLPLPLTDPCKKTKASTTAANDLLHEPNISTEVSTLEGHAVNSFTEYGMAIINTGTTTIAQDPYSNNDPNNPGKVTITVPTVGNFLATGHTHPDHGAPPPSPADFYVTLEYARDYPTFQTSLIFVYNGTKYALVVNDRAKAIAFLAAYPFSSTTITVDDKKVFNRSSQIGKDFNDILESFSRGAFPNYSGSDQNDGLETAMAYILDKYDAGINIAKADATGNLKALRPVSFNHTIPASGGKTVIAYKAQMCP